MDARMTYTIARREWRERLRNGHFQAVIVALALLFLVSFAVSLSQWKSADAEQRQAQSRDREQWLNQGSRNPHSAAHFGVYAFKPRLPLSFVDPGLDPYTGSVIWVEAHYQNPARFRPAEEATALQRFGQLTPAVVLQWFLPLFIVLLCFSAFTAEKEQGTLGLTLALGVPPGQLAAGKALGVAAAAGCILLPVALLTGLAVWGHRAGVYARRDMVAADPNGSLVLGLPGHFRLRKPYCFRCIFLLSRLARDASRILDSCHLRRPARGR
jgi:ABC-2 type transport system permease protein